jgi:CheY-like chemotaxis protein
MPAILLIEDEAPLRTSIAAILRHRGFMVIEASNGSEGVQLSKTCKADLILSDVRMPEMDGLALLEALRKEPATARTPFILMTGMPDETDLRRAYGSGAADYLVKPIQTSDLVAAINTQIAKHREFSHG